MNKFDCNVVRRFLSNDTKLTQNETAKAVNVHNHKSGPSAGCFMAKLSRKSKSTTPGLRCH